MNKLAHLRDSLKHKAGKFAGKVASVMALGMVAVPAFAADGDIQTQILAEITTNKAIAIAVCTAFIIATLSIRSLKLAKKG